MPTFTEASNSRIPAAHPPSYNAYQSQPPSTGFQSQPPKPTFHSQQPQPNAFMQPQPPTSQVHGSHPPPTGYPPSEPPQMSGTPMRGAVRTQFGDHVSAGSVPTYMNSGPPQFPSGLTPSAQEPPGDHWAAQQNVTAGHQDNYQRGAFDGPTSQLIRSGPYSSQSPSASDPAGFPAPGYQGQKTNFPGALPDGSYRGAPGFPHGPPYLAQGNFAQQQPLKRKAHLDDMPSQVCCF